MTPLRIAFAGTPEFAVPALRALIESPHQVAGVLTQPDRPRGRGRRVSPSAVKLEAQHQGLPCAQPATLRSAEERSDLSRWQPDLLVVVAYGLILPGEALLIPRFGSLNIHASLLPRWRGAAPVQRAILAGDTQSGVTIMRMDEGLDTGPILLQRPIPIGSRDTTGTLQARLATLGARALLEALPLVTEVDRSTPQSGDGVTYAAKIQKSEARISWGRAAVELDRQIRAFNPWPIAETTLEGETLRIHAAYAVADAPEDAEDPSQGSALRGLAGSAIVPGTITGVRSDGLTVRCGRGSLVLTEVQRPGRSKITAREFSARESLPGRRFD